MEEREYITSLYEIYNKLLSQREREYFENYYFIIRELLSLSIIRFINLLVLNSPA